RSTTDVESLRELLSEGLQELIGVILSFASISLMLLWLDFGLGAVAVLSFVPLYLLVRLYQRRAGVLYAARSTAIAAVIVKFAESMNGIRPVQDLNSTHAWTNGGALLEMARYVVGSRLVANTAVAGIVLWGAYRVASGTLALGVLAAAVLYLRRLYDPIDRLGMFLNSYQSAAASLEKIAGLLAQAPSVPEPSKPRELPALTGEHPGREVVFDSVRFAYRTGGEVLPRFDLTVPAGQTVAVVGSTGAGKSTLANTLLGRDVMEVQAAREVDGKGRHTTTTRNLLVLPSGGVLIDTPGLRGVGLWDAETGVGQVFSEIEELAEQCRFHDCGHRSEPGCAVLAAIEDGSLPERRLDSFRKLLRENQRIVAKTDARVRSEMLREWKRKGAEGRAAMDAKRGRVR
uniref:ribosome small subunit-dependent GTPase A n=1 Tax=Bacillus thuringiensis TaxID=1428 RepID=UPI0035E13671